MFKIVEGSLIFRDEKIDFCSFVRSVIWQMVLFSILNSPYKIRFISFLILDQVFPVSFSEILTRTRAIKQRNI